MINFSTSENAKKSITELPVYSKIAGRRKKVKSKNEKIEEGVEIWTSFYRANPHRFVEDFLKIKLKLFQQILLYLMMHYNFFTYIAARGQGKTFLTAIFGITRMILFPETKIKAAAGQKSQGKEIITKIKEIANRSPLLRNELLEGMKSIKDSTNNLKVEMAGGSWLEVIAAADGARGGRANLLIVDEYRLVPLDIIDTVLRKMQADPRQCGFMTKPEYKGKEEYQERNKQIFLSSAWYKAHEAWDRVVSYNASMVDGQSYFGCAIPYQVSVMEGLKLRAEIQDEMSELTFNEVKWAMEMEAIFWGTNEKSYFKYEEIQKNRVLLDAYYPREIRNMLPNNVLRAPEKNHDEKIVLSADIALMGGASNDAAVFTIAKCIPTKNGIERQLLYIESHDGGHTNIIANRIRQLFEDFNCDYLVLDTGGLGLGVYDQLIIETIDPERGTKYTPMTCFNDEKMASRCIYANANPVIYSIKGQGELNSRIAEYFKDTLRRGMFKLPVHEDESVDIIRGYKGYETLEPEYKTLLKLPYIQTSIMATEILNLEDENAGIKDQVKIKESRTARKDKYSSISYLNYFVTDYLELNNQGSSMEVDVSKLFMFKKANSRAKRSGTYF